MRSHTDWTLRRLVFVASWTAKLSTRSWTMPIDSSPLRRPFDSPNAQYRSQRPAAHHMYGWVGPSPPGTIASHPTQRTSIIGQPVPPATQHTPPAQDRVAVASIPPTCDFWPISLITPLPYAAVGLRRTPRPPPKPESEKLQRATGRAAESRA